MKIKSLLTTVLFSNILIRAYKGYYKHMAIKNLGNYACNKQVKKYVFISHEYLLKTTLKIIKTKIT
jgi:hypothetical protein